MGYYVSSKFSENYIKNTKNEDGTYVYDTEVNKMGINTQRDLHQLNKQYNNTINNAYASNLLANRGIRSSNLGTGYKDAYIESLQNEVNQEVEATKFSVKDAKMNIFASLNNNLGALAGMQQDEVNNMRRTASSLEQYYDYLGTVNSVDGTGFYRGEHNGFKVGEADTFEDNYNQILGIDKGMLTGYIDENSNQALAFEDWVRQNNGDSDGDTAWLDWLYSKGLNQYKDFIGYSNPYTGATPDIPTTPLTRTAKKKWWEDLYIPNAS